VKTTRLTGASDWKDGFLFVGNHLALDFLNTRPVQNGEAQELLSDFSSLLRWFRAAELLNNHQIAILRQRWEGSPRARLTLEEVCEFREALRKEVLRWEARQNIHRARIKKLNTLLAAHPMLTRLTETGDGARMTLSFDPRQPDDLFAPLAHSAARLFAEADRTRVRKCGQCVLHFLDTSKKGTRRWCSMQLCGNRLKVAAYAQRKRISHGTVVNK
jgi:predicted RNA-binding Zn ribbon-like protein